MFSAACLCLFVCLFVSQHDNFRTIKHGMMKLNWRLGTLYKNLTRVRMSSSKVKCQGHRRQKKRKSAAVCSGVVLWGAVFRQFYAGGKISACCRVKVYRSFNGYCSLLVWSITTVRTLSCGSMLK